MDRWAELSSSSGRGRLPAGWALPQPCLPLVSNPSVVLLLGCWSVDFAFQLVLVTTDLWPWTHQTSTQNKSVFHVDSVLFPVRPLQVEVLSPGTQLPYSPPSSEQEGQVAQLLLAGRRGCHAQAPPWALPQDKLPAFSELQFPHLQQEVNACVEEGDGGRGLRTYVRP